MIKVSCSQSKRRAYGGALSSGHIANSAEGSLPFRCDRILSISPVVRHSLFDASDDLDLPRALLAGLDVDIKHPFQPLHPGHDWWRSAGVLSIQFSPVG